MKEKLVSSLDHILKLTNKPAMISKSIKCINDFEPAYFTKTFFETIDLARKLKANILLQAALAYSLYEVNKPAFQILQHNAERLNYNQMISTLLSAFHNLDVEDLRESLLEVNKRDSYFIITPNIISECREFMERNKYIVIGNDRIERSTEFINELNKIVHIVFEDTKFLDDRTYSYHRTKAVEPTLDAKLGITQKDSTDKKGKDRQLIEVNLHVPIGLRKYIIGEARIRGNIFWDVMRTFEKIYRESRSPIVFFTQTSRDRID